MYLITNLQMSLFGSFINIKPKTELVIQLLTALKEEQFIPGSADIANVDLKTGKMTVESRMQMISPDRTWAIVFLEDRIDFNFIRQPSTEDYKKVEQVIDYTRKLIERVFSVFGATTGNRLAVNCKFITENMSADELKVFFDRYTKPLGAFAEDNYAEWSVRFNTRSNMQVSNDAYEMCNRIVEMAQVEKNEAEGDTLEVSKAIMISLDINTDALNQSNRFKYDNLLLFSEGASSFITEVIKEIEG